MMNIINGGAHADNPIDIQEFMILPTGADSFAEGLRMGAEIFHALKAALKAAGHNTNVGDEGGFAPNLSSAEEALSFIVRAGESAGYKAGSDFQLGLDAASTEFFKAGRYELEGEGKIARCRPAWSTTSPPWWTPSRSSPSRTAAPRTTWRAGPCSPSGSASASSWSATTCSSPIPSGWRWAQARGLANSILVKVNQIGTLSETLDAVDMAHRRGYTAVMSHRSGETEDVTIADLAVATNCGQIKTGSLARSDRVAKYNQLLRIEEQLGDQAVYAGAEPFTRFDTGR